MMVECPLQSSPLRACVWLSGRHLLLEHGYAPRVAATSDPATLRMYTNRPLCGRHRRVLLVYSTAIVVVLSIINNAIATAMTATKKYSESAVIEPQASGGAVQWLELTDRLSSVLVAQVFADIRLMENHDCGRIQLATLLRRLGRHSKAKLQLNGVSAFQSRSGRTGMFDIERTTTP